MTAWFVPGRLEVLGKHTDYAGGNSLLAAVEQGITIELEDATCGISAVTTASPGEELALIPNRPNALPAGHWGGYLQTVIDRLALNFGELRPARLVIDSTLPLASGMSSSSALVVAVALILIDHNGFREGPEWRENITSVTDLAGYLACIENGMSLGSLTGVRGVGTFGGSEDHTAMLCCQADRLTRFRFCPIREGESVTLPGDLSFVVGVSGVLAEKSGAALELYNAASLQTQEIVSAWNSATGAEALTIGEILASDEDAWEGLSAVVAHSPALSARLRAFLVESEELIPAARPLLGTATSRPSADWPTVPSATPTTTWAIRCLRPSGCRPWPATWGRRPPPVSGRASVVRCGLSRLPPRPMISPPPGWNVIRLSSRRSRKGPPP